VRPLLVVAALMALAVAAINEFYAPHAAEQARAMRENRFKPLTNTEILNIPYYNHQARRVWRINHMRSDQPNRIEGVRISFDRPDGSRQLDITCRSAEYLDGLWWLFYPQYQYFDELNNPIENPKPQLADLVIRAMPELNESPRDFLLMNKAWEVASKTFDVHARLAAPFSCLIITLFAIPAGMASGRQSVFKGVLLAVALFFGFYVVTNGCMVLAKNGLMPVILGAWCANVIFLAAGLALFYRQR
jgi:lipopolysaccharide export LptBFGC system permease protein LptF